MVGNPNHDPKTGRFASRSGLNKNNSTVTQRGKARVKEHISDAKAYALAGGAAVAGAVGAAVLQGISRPIRYKGAQLSHQAIAAAETHANNLISRHGPSVAGALKNAIPAAKHYGPKIVGSIASHAKNMAKSIGSQHRAPTSVGSASSSVKPRVRVPMSGGSKPKVRVPMGRK